MQVSYPPATGTRSRHLWSVGDAPLATSSPQQCPAFRQHPPHRTGQDPQGLPTPAGPPNTFNAGHRTTQWNGSSPLPLSLYSRPGWPRCPLPPSPSHPCVFAILSWRLSAELPGRGMALWSPAGLSPSVMDPTSLTPHMLRPVGASVANPPPPFPHCPVLFPTTSRPMRCPSSAAPPCTATPRWRRPPAGPPPCASTPGRPLPPCLHFVSFSPPLLPPSPLLGR